MYWAGTAAIEAAACAAQTKVWATAIALVGALAFFCAVCVARWAFAPRRAANIGVCLACGAGVAAQTSVDLDLDGRSEGAHSGVLTRKRHLNKRIGAGRRR